MSRPRPSLPQPALMLVTDAMRCGGDDVLVEVVRRAVAGGVNIVQLREKHLATADAVALGRRLGAAIEGRALLLVNGDIDAAVELEAHGVHLPASGMAVPDAISRCGGAMLISRAVHSIEAAARAERDSADVLLLGTVFPSASHPQGARLGLDGVRAVCGRVRTPVIAIGGVTSASAGDVLRAGACGVAAIGALLDSDDPEQAARELRAALAQPASV